MTVVVIALVWTALGCGAAIEREVSHDVVTPDANADVADAPVGRPDTHDSDAPPGEFLRDDGRDCREITPGTEAPCPGLAQCDDKTGACCIGRLEGAGCRCGSSLGCRFDQRCCGVAGTIDMECRARC